MTDKRIGIIVQARERSTRLPDKILKKITTNLTILDLLIRRLQLSKCKYVNDIIIATTLTNSEKIVKLVDNYEDQRVKYFLGDEDNVLKRYYDAAKYYNLEIIVRITSDCPFSDPKMIDNLLSNFEQDECDYLCNFITPNRAEGFDVEIFTFETLKRVYEYASTKEEREHVTWYIYAEHPELFKIRKYPIQILGKYGKKLRLTVDEKADLEMCREVYKRIIEQGKDPIKFSLKDIIDIIDKEPELMNINKHIIQKAYGNIR